MRSAFLAALAVLVAAACSGSDAVLVGNSIHAASAAINPPVLRALDGIRGWKRTGPPKRYRKEGLYGHIDGGAEIVLQYGFRELSVYRFEPTAGAVASKEIVLEIYRMTSGEAAFGLYSTRLEGGEESWPGIKSDHWMTIGQASLVKGEYLVNILALECAAREIGEFAVALEPRIPGRGTLRPRGLDWLPSEGMVPSSRRYIKGPLAAQNESPFLEGEFWGFVGTAEGQDATAAYSARYGVRPAISKLVIVELGKTQASVIEDKVMRSFCEYLEDIRREGQAIEGRNDAGRWFLFKREGAIAVFVLGDPDPEAARTRLGIALARALGKPGD